MWVVLRVIIAHDDISGLNSSFSALARHTVNTVFCPINNEILFDLFRVHVVGAVCLLASEVPTIDLRSSLDGDLNIFCDIGVKFLLL